MEEGAKEVQPERPMRKKGDGNVETKKNKCSYCKTPGHSIRTCMSKKTDEAFQGESVMDYGEVEHGRLQQAQQPVENSTSPPVNSQTFNHEKSIQLGDTHSGIIKAFRPPAQYPGNAPLGIQPENYKTLDGRMYTTMRTINELKHKKKKQIEVPTN